MMRIPTIYDGVERYIPSEIRRELQGVLGLNPFDQHDSASRKQMFSSHIGQCLVVEGSTERHIRTGMENEYGKYTFSVTMPVDADIIRVIERYPRVIGEGSIAHNPETLVIYEDVHTKEVGCISLTDYFSHHQYFGFKYKRTSACARLRAGESIPAGTVLANSPSVTDAGGYKYGVECNVAFMSHPSVSEDGVMISRDVLHRFSFKTFETRVVEWGQKHFPLNMYGDENHYKPHPDIGDLIRDDGILMAFRSYDDNLSPVEQSRLSTMRVDPSFDKRVYAAGPGTIEGATISGKVIDIRVMHDPESSVPTTPVGMEAQTQKYDVARRRFYQEIYNVYERLHRERGANLKMSHDFDRLVVEAISVIQPSKKNAGKESTERVQKIYKAIPLDDWRVEFVIEYTVTPTIGFKFTDSHGGKGVCCHVAEPHEMPVDEAGNRADMVFDPGATVSRMNLGRLYEQYLNSASRDLAREIIYRLDNQQTIPAIESHPNFQAVWERLLRYYQIVSPRMHAWFVSGTYTKRPAEHVREIIQQGMIQLYYPPENEIHPPTMIRLLEQEFKPTYGPVSYIGYSGKKSVTKYPVRIGSVYIIILEKTGDDWTALASGKWQNFGVLAQITSRDKFSNPTRQQSIRADGETEVRIKESYIGPLMTAEILDRNNSIQTHAQMLDSIYQAPQPTNIECAVNRDENPLGNARPLQLVKHLALCGGWKFSYAPFQPHVPDPGFKPYD